MDGWMDGWIDRYDNSTTERNVTKNRWVCMGQIGCESYWWVWKCGIPQFTSMLVRSLGFSSPKFWGILFSDCKTNPYPSGICKPNFEQCCWRGVRHLQMLWRSCAVPLSNVQLRRVDIVGPWLCQSAKLWMSKPGYQVNCPILHPFSICWYIYIYRIRQNYGKKKNVSIYRRRLSMIEKLRTFFFP